MYIKEELIHKIKKINKDEYIVTSKKGKNGYILIDVDWREVPRYDNNNKLIPPEIFKDKIISSKGLQYFNQNFANKFLGSSDTLINPNVIYELPKKVNENYVFYKDFKIYEDVIPNNYYICSVDTKQEGIDGFSIIVTNVTKIPFKVVAVYNKEKVNLLEMPFIIKNIAEKYNNALVIQESNVEVSLLKILKYNLEYDNIQKSNGKLGVRMTKQTKPLLLNLMKQFIENNKIILNDKTLIYQLLHFVRSKKGNSYIAENGYKDDLVMALSLTFYPFIDYKNLENYEGFLKMMEEKEKEKEALQEMEGDDLLNVIDFGFVDY